MLQIQGKWHEVASKEVDGRDSSSQRLTAAVHPAKKPTLGKTYIQIWEYYDSIYDTSE